MWVPWWQKHRIVVLSFWAGYLFHWLYHEDCWADRKAEIGLPVVRNGPAVCPVQITAPERLQVIQQWKKFGGLAAIYKPHLDCKVCQRKGATRRILCLLKCSKMWFGLLAFFLNRRYSVNVTYKTKLATHQAALMKYCMPDARQRWWKMFLPPADASHS